VWHQVEDEIAVIRCGAAPRLSVTLAVALVAIVALPERLPGQQRHELSPPGTQRTPPPANAAATPLFAQSSRLIVTAPSNPVIDRVDRYSRGDQGQSGVAPMPRWELVALIQELQRVVPGWVRAGGVADGPRRRLAAATYVLDLLNVNFRIAWAPGTGREMLEWACDLLRDAPPAMPEKIWHMASLALFERFEIDMSSHLSHVERRFPGEGRWLLARALNEEFATWPERRDETPFLQLSAASEQRIVGAFRDATADATIGGEARLRWGYLELRRGHVTEALDHFDQIGTLGDATLRYWFHLFHGRALEQAHRPADAVEAYRFAFAEAPYAQSATMALASALVADRRATEAAAFVIRMLRAESAPFDPWTIYTFPDYRLWPTLFDELRVAIAP